MKPTTNIFFAIIFLQSLTIPTMQARSALVRDDYLAYAMNAACIVLSAAFAARNIAAAVRKLRDENAKAEAPSLSEVGPPAAG